MKRQMLYATLLLLIAGLFMINAYVRLEYRVGFVEYLRLSSDYTSGEKALLKERAPLIYGGNISEPPLGIYNAESGQYSGMIVDYISALSIELGETIVSRPMVWNDALLALEHGETDLCDMIPSLERQQTYLFSAPIYDLNGAVVVAADSQIEAPNALSGRRVVVQKGDYAIELMQRQGITPELLYVDNMFEAMTLLKEGKADAAVGDEPVAYHYLSALGMEDAFRILDTPLYRNRVSLGVAKKNKELLRVIDKAVFKLRKKGILAQIQKKWSHPTPGFYKDISADKLRITLIAVALVFCLALYLIWIWTRSLRILVAKRTRELEGIKNELQTVFDSMSSLLAVVDAHGKVISVNGAFLKTQGIAENDVAGKPYMMIPLLRFFDEASGHRIQRWMEMPDSGDTSEKYEFRYENRIIVGRCSLLDMDKSGQRQLLLMLEDETVSRLQEMRLIHANKMEAVGVLAAGVAHELRNPLGIIRNSGFVLKSLDPEDTGYRDMAVTAIENSVSRASRIIDNLLNHSRLTDGVADRVRLKPFLEEILQLFTEQMVERRIVARFDCPEALSVVTLSSSLWHGLLNIIQNALDVMPTGGTLTVHIHEDTSGVHINIKDTGPGISSENMDKLFDPFFTTKDVGLGTGLGLYIAYIEIQKAGGCITVQSTLGIGTCFTLTIPVGGA